MREIVLGTVRVSDSSAPYVIAEIGVNHEGSMDTARKLIDLAKEGGADAAKFQTYKAETLASRHSPAYWDLGKEPTTSQFRLFQKYDGFGPDEYHALSEHCGQMEIDFASTPFDSAAVDMLAPLMPYFKIASADLTNTPLLRQVAAFGKAVILSTGASTMAEVGDAVGTLRSAGCSELSLLHCVLNYPTADENAKLGMISELRSAYPEVVVGYSDHTIPDKGMTALCTAFVLGARVIEKHFTNDKSLPGNDHYHAMDVHDLKRFRAGVARLDGMIGLDNAGTAGNGRPAEETARVNARRSIVLDADVEAGASLTGAILTCKRPGTGVSPVHWDELLGRRTARPLKRDHVLQWTDLVPLD